MGGWILKKKDERRGLDCAGSGQGQVEGPCVEGNEPSGVIECGEFLDWLRNYWLVKRDCAALS
jgi:hypothetical protein